MAETNPCVDQKQVNTKLSSFLLHVLCEADKVAPVSTVVLFLDVAFKPSVGIRRVKEVDLSPFQRALWHRSCILRVGLHPPNISSENHIILERSVAAVVAFTRRS